MRILLVTSSMDQGGAESHIFSLAKGLFRLGHYAVVASSGGGLAEELERINIKHERISLNGRSPLKLLRARRELLRLVDSESFDIIHAHSRLAAFVARGVSEERDIPFVTTVHARFSVSLFYRHFSRWGRPTIAVSEDLRDYLCSCYGISSENTRLVPNGIDTERFFPISIKDDRRLRVVFASRLDRDCSEGAFLLCRMYERMRECFPNIEILICGGGECYEELVKLSEGKESLHLLGNVERMEEVLQNADAFVGVSRAAMEAMACGIPTVLGGNEGFFGFLRNEEELRRAALENFCCRGMDRLSEEGLYFALCKCLCLSKEERTGIGEMLTSYIRENHDALDMARRTAEVYREAISLPSKNRGDVVLCGYYGYGNMGDNALLRASLTLAKKHFPNMSISALTKRPKKDRVEFNLRCVNRMSLFAVRRELSGASVLVLGGGTLLQDTTSLRSLIYYTSIIRYAGKKGARVELWGNGLGVPRSAFGERLIKRALCRCEYVGLRDLSSLYEGYRMCESNREGRLFYEPDLAKGQKAANGSRVDYLLKRYGINEESTPYGYAVVAIRGASAQGYIEIMQKWLMTLCSDGIRLLFVPMFPKEDESLSRRLCSELGGVVVHNISESDMVGLIGRSRVVCGMRFHSLVFASAADVPFVGFGGDSKIERFCRENGGLYFTDLY